MSTHIIPFAQLTIATFTFCCRYSTCRTSFSFGSYGVQRSSTLLCPLFRNLCSLSCHKDWVYTRRIVFPHVLIIGTPGVIRKPPTNVTTKQPGPSTSYLTRTSSQRAPQTIYTNPIKILSLHVFSCSRCSVFYHWKYSTLSLSVVHFVADTLHLRNVRVKVNSRKNKVFGI